MTTKEAIEMIKDDMRLHHDSLSGTYRQALNMAIEALKEKEYYMKKYPLSPLLEELYKEDES